MIIIDDFSSDRDSILELEKYINLDSRIKLIKSGFNAGAAIARNLGIEIAKGDYIAFLDSDDIWHSNKLENQIEFMIDNDVMLSYSSYRKVNINSNVINILKPPSKLSYKDILKCNRIGCLTAVYNARELGKIYMPNIAKRQDMGLWLKILKKIDFAYGIDEVLADYRVSNNSLSSNKLNVIKYQWRIYREVEHINFPGSLYFLSQYAINGMRNRV